MSKTIVAYFSASGVTKTVAERLAKAVKADLFEIVPEPRYTAADLDWRDSSSRSTVEMKDLSSRPPIAARVENIGEYDAVFLGFPIWWGREPSVIDTFLDACDFNGQSVVPFCTSGGSGVGNTSSRLQEILGSKAHVHEGKLFPSSASEKSLADWAETLKL